ARRDAAEENAAAGRQRLEDEPRANARVEPLPVHDDAARDGPLWQHARRGDGRRRRRAVAVDRDVAVERATHHLEQRVELEGLLEEVARAEANHAHRRLDRAVARDDDDRQPRRAGPHALDELDSVDLRHPHVDDRQAGLDVLEQLERASAVMPSPLSAISSRTMPSRDTSVVLSSTRPRSPGATCRRAAHAATALWRMLMTARFTPSRSSSSSGRSGSGTKTKSISRWPSR